MKTLIILMLTTVMPPDQPDRHRQMPESSIEKCWEDARAIIEAGIPPEAKQQGAIAIVAGCLVRPGAEEKS